VGNRKRLRDVTTACAVLIVCAGLYVWPAARSTVTAQEAKAPSTPPTTAPASKPRRRNRGGNPGEPTPYDKLDYGPFLSSSVLSPVQASPAAQAAAEARAREPEMGTSTKAADLENGTWKGVTVRLGEPNEAALTFDTQLLRASAGWIGTHQDSGWTNGFLHLRNVAFTGDHGPAPTIAGTLKFSTRNTPGWADANGTFKDPRPEPFGGMPRDYLHYKGLYRSGDRVAFSYSVNGADVLETPGLDADGEDIAFTRTFRLAASRLPQTLAVCVVEGATGGVGPIADPGTAAQGPAGKNIAVLNGAGGVTAAGLVQPPKGAKWKIADQDGPTILLTIPAHADVESFSLVIWNGPKEELAHFGDHLKAPVIDVSTLTHGGPSHWPKPLETEGKLAVEPKDPKAPYVLDELTPPKLPDGWPQMELGGFDFFPDGKSAALCTWKGDVYVVSGIDDRLDHLTWKRVAGGLFQSLGLKIVNGEIYVMGRDQVTILHDLDGDGEADFYENFNNDVAITDHFHEFAFDLDQDSAGNFYFAKAGGVNAGGNGFQRPITPNHGTVMRLAKDGSKLEVMASGFRAPNGIAVNGDGQIVTGDNQGTWVPADRLNWVKTGGFYGVVDLAHRQTRPTVTDNPLCWFPYPDWDNSCGDPVWCTSDKFGPLQGELLYLSYGQTTLMKILKEEVDGQMQGGAIRFPFHFQSGCMRARFSPVDGQLYVCGFRGWQTNAGHPTAFERVRYTGATVQQVSQLHVKDNGVEITFLQPLNKESAADAGAWSVEEWNYRWDNIYGSPKFKPSAPGKEGTDTLNVKSAKVSDDGKTVFLEIPDLHPVMQMLIQANGIESADGAPVKVEIANTINHVKGKDLVVSVGKVSSK
jgi:hypothetical protein